MEIAKALFNVALWVSVCGLVLMHFEQKAEIEQLWQALQQLLN